MDKPGIFEKNCRVIEEKNSELATELRTFSGESIELLRAKNGEYTFKYGGRFFHSGYDPAKEAAEQVEDVLSKKPDWVVIFGLGLGYLLRTFVERGHFKLIIYEPEMEILHGALSAVDLSEELSHKSVYLCSDMMTATHCIRDFVDGMDSLLSYQPGAYRATFEREFIDFTNRVQNAQTTTQVAVKTNIDSRLPWIENYLENFSYLPDTPSIDVLRGRFTGKPMIVVGAGPSLNKNGHLLKELKGRVIIMAAVTAYKPLLKLGVVPDFVIAGERIDMPEYFTDGEPDKEIRLILAEVSSPALFQRQAKGRFVFFNAFNHLSGEQAKMWGSGYFASIGGSVTTSALDMGIMFGCDPVIFVGQDLAFGDGETHVAGGVYEGQSLKIDSKTGVGTIDWDYADGRTGTINYTILWLKGLNGTPVASKFDWVTFHQWFETYMHFMVKEGMRQKVINATEGGAYIEGMEHISLKEAIERYVGAKVGIDRVIDLALKDRAPVDFIALGKSLVRMSEGLVYIKKQAVKILKEVKKIRAAHKKSGLTSELLKYVKRIEGLEKNLFDMTRKTPFLWEALSAYTHKLKENLRSEHPAGEEDKFKEDIDITEETYKEVLSMTERFFPVFDRAQEVLKSKKSAGGECAV